MRVYKIEIADPPTRIDGGTAIKEVAIKTHWDMCLHDFIEVFELILSAEGMRNTQLTVQEEEE